MAGTAKLAAAAAAKLIAKEPRDGCGYCRRALGADVRIECAVCAPRLLLCVECFHAGVSIHTRGHTAGHAYRVIDVGREALLEVGWRAGDELKLLEAMQLYGFGNWADIATHVGGGRTRQEVEAHYRRCYLESPNFPQPNFERIARRSGPAAKAESGAAAAPAPLSEHMTKAAAAAAASADAALAAAGGQSYVPGPDPAEVAPRPPEADFAYAGWMPLRGEFDTVRTNHNRVLNAPVSNAPLPCLLPAGTNPARLERKHPPSRLSITMSGSLQIRTCIYYGRLQCFLLHIFRPRFAPFLCKLGGTRWVVQE